MVGLTVSGGALLWTFSVKLPAAPSSLEYFAQGNSTEPAWGDGSDCSNVNGVQQCLTLPAIQFVFTGSTPSNIVLAALMFYFLCNGTIYLQAPLTAMAWIPGSTGTPSGSAPQLGNCGSYVPPHAAFNRLAFFFQLSPGSPSLQPGDSIVMISHTFTSFNDDDFHGVPPWCFTVPAACTVEISYSGPPSAVVLSIPIENLSPLAG